MINFYEPIISKEDILSVVKSLENKYLSGNTPVIKEFESAVSQVTGVKYVSSCSSGTAALHLSLLGLGIHKGDEVLIPSLSYIATANAVSYVGGTPIFVDIEKDSWQIDPYLIEKNITKRTKAIIPVHLYGGVPNLIEIEKIAKKYSLKIIHDTAEALGSKYNGKYATGYKDVSVLSFFPNKVITTGEGGAVCTNNKKIFDLVEKLKSQGLKGKREYVHSHIGYNYRMTSMSASLGLSQINRVDSYILKKRELYENYKKELQPLGFEFQKFNQQTESSFWLISTLLPNRFPKNKFKKYLFNNNIDSRNIFVPLHLQKPYKRTNTDEFKNSIEISKRGLCLPSSPNLNINDFNYIIKTIKKFQK